MYIWLLQKDGKSMRKWDYSCEYETQSQAVIILLILRKSTLSSSAMTSRDAFLIYPRFHVIFSLALHHNCTLRMVWDFLSTIPVQPLHPYVTSYRYVYIHIYIYIYKSRITPSQGHLPSWFVAGHLPHCLVSCCVSRVVKLIGHIHTNIYEL